MGADRAEKLGGPGLDRPGWWRRCLLALETGVYRLLRAPVFLLLVVFRRYAGR